MITPEQWKEIETSLNMPWGRVRLRVDGYDLELQVQQIEPLRFAIIPFVNGWSRGAWLSRNEAGEWCEEARRFLPIKRRCLFSAAQLKRAGKKLAKVWRQKTFEHRSLYWTTFASLKRHLVANNESIELVALEANP